MAEDDNVVDDNTLPVVLSLHVENVLVFVVVADDKKGHESNTDDKGNRPDEFGIIFDSQPPSQQQSPDFFKTTILLPFATTIGFVVFRDENDTTDKNDDSNFLIPPQLCTKKVILINNFLQKYKNKNKTT
jgi:hypothetical protein